MVQKSPSKQPELSSESNFLSYGPKRKCSKILVDREEFSNEEISKDFHCVYLACMNESFSSSNLNVVVGYVFLQIYLKLATSSKCTDAETFQHHYRNSIYLEEAFHKKVMEDVHNLFTSTNGNVFPNDVHRLRSVEQFSLAKPTFTLKLDDYNTLMESVKKSDYPYVLQHIIPTLDVSIIYPNVVSVKQNDFQMPSQHYAVNSILYYSIHLSHSNVIDAAITVDGSFLAAGLDDSTVCLWNVIQHNSIQKSHTQSMDNLWCKTLVGHTGPVHSVVFGPEATCLSASRDCSVRLWKHYETQIVYRAHSFPVWNVSVSSNDYFISSSMDCTVKLWTYSRQFALRTYARHSSDVNVARFHPNNIYVATGSSDHLVCLWSLNEGTYVRLLHSHKYPVTAVEFSPDGLSLLSGDANGHVMLWDLRSGKPLATCALETHSRILSLLFSNDSTYFFVAGSTGSIVRVPTQDLTSHTVVASGCSDYTFNLTRKTANSFWALGSNCS